MNYFLNRPVNVGLIPVVEVLEGIDEYLADPSRLVSVGVRLNLNGPPLSVVGVFLNAPAAIPRPD